MSLRWLDTGANRGLPVTSDKTTGPFQSNSTTMHQLAVQLRAAQLYAHSAHNLVRGDEFFADHEFLGELYPAYEAAYDQVVERMIGLGIPFDPQAVVKDAAKEAGSYSFEGIDCCAIFTVLSSFEGRIRQHASSYYDVSSPGTQNLLAQLCDDSEARTYKLIRRTLE